MKKKFYITGSIFVFIILIITGCFDFFNIDNNIVIYESCPTAVNYTFTYGYKITCTGEGKYSINYDLDLPEVVNGRLLSTKIHENNYELVKLATYNDIIKWEITSNDNTDYELLITADVKAENFIISDLNGFDALTIEQISKQYPNIVNQFCNAQSNETTAFIDPFNQEILEISSEVYKNAKTNNSLLIAKELFKWLKQNTMYKTHEPYDNIVQTAATTLSRKTGDCDDLSFLYISLCRALMIPSRFIKGFLINKHSAIQHVWVEVFVGGVIGKEGWIPVECAGVSDDVQNEINQNFGVENIEHLRLFTDDGSNESLNIFFSGLTYKIFGENRNIDTNFYTNITNYSITKSQKLIVEKNQNSL
ncbi:MAG: transglutaminase-like domain-containing protein [Thermoplasmatota archaeon]|jgi:hypothetical protein